MMDEHTALVPTSDQSPVSGTEQLVAAFLEGRSPATMAAYRRDLEDYSTFVGAPSVTEAARRLLGRGHGEANRVALAYRAHLVERGLAPATTNRRLAALRSLVKLSRTLGMVGWTLEVSNVRSEPYRDTKGPGVSGYRRLLAAVGHGDDPKSLRDRAVVHLLYDLALRRGEVVGLDVADLDLDAGTLAVLGKGRTERITLTLPQPTHDALTAWLDARGPQPGPLFTNFDRAGKGGRLTGTSVYRLAVTLGKKAGLGHVRPHGLRHTAITSALDLTCGDVRAVQRFSRHKSLAVLMAYDDNRKDLGGVVARQVAEAGVR